MFGLNLGLDLWSQQQVVGGGGGGAATVWDPAFNSSVYTISGAGLIATRGVGAGSGDQMQKAQQSKTSGYFEVVVNAMAIGANIGIADSSEVAANYVGGSVHSVGAYSGGTPTWTAGDVIGVCLKAGNVYFSKNNVWMGGADPSAGTGGTATSIVNAMPAVSCNAASASNQFTLRVSSGFSGTIPTGVAAWG